MFEKFQSGVKLTDDEMQKLAKDASLANRALDSMSKGLFNLGKSALNLGKKLYEGEQGAAANNEMVQTATDALSDFASNFGIIGKVIGKLISLFGSYAQEVNKMSDRLYKSYQTLSKVGVTAADGMMGIAESAQRLGYGLNEVGLENFGRLMKASAQDLALLSGSAVQGRKDFTDFASEVVRGSAGRELMNLGYSVEELNEGLAGYIGLQARVGLAQNKTQAELRAGATAYLKEMDALTKLTGLQKAELEEGINKGRAIEAFRAKLEDMRANGQEKEADAMEKYYAVMLKQAPTIAQGFAEAASGLIVSDAGRQYNLAIDQGANVIQNLTTGAMSLEQALGATYKQAKLSEGEFRQLAMAMASGNVIGSYTELADIAKRSGISQEEMAKSIKEAQDAQAQGPGGVAAQTDLRRSQMDSRDALQNLVKAGVQPATSAMSAFSKVTGKVVTALGGTVSNAVNAVVPGTVSAAPTPMSGGGGAAGGGGGGAAGGGGGGGLAGVKDAAGGGGVGFFRALGMGMQGLGLGATGPGPGTVGNVRPEDLIKFTSGTGTSEHFGKLEPSVQQAFLSMAQDYSNLTGDKLQVNSAFRSHDEQAAVNPGANPKAAPGMSKHNIGRAVDIQSSQKDFLQRQGLLDRYGFKTLANDPPHIFMKDGGIATGPRSGYAATLHGTEAVIPLPDGKTIPVVMPELTSGLQDQMSMMGAQLVALENLVAIMRDQTTISTKILQASNN